LYLDYGASEARRPWEREAVVGPSGEGAKRTPTEWKDRGASPVGSRGFPCALFLYLLSGELLSYCNTGSLALGLPGYEQVLLSFEVASIYEDHSSNMVL
jgi:hypothetical protein